MKNGIIIINAARHALDYQPHLLGCRGKTSLRANWSLEGNC